MTKERIEKSVEIINYAIQNEISVREASIKCGYADTYIKNIKAIVYEKYESGNLEDELFTLFDEKLSSMQKETQGEKSEYTAYYEFHKFG